MAETGYRTTGGKIGRVFNGEKYLLNNQTATQAGARAIAKDLRGMGYMARVYHHPAGEVGFRWWVFRRAKR